MLKKIASFLLSFSLFFVLVPSLAHSQTFNDALKGAGQTAEGSGIKEKNKTQEIEDYIKTLTTIALSLIGVIFFILTVYGGFKWMLAKGDAKEVDKAKDIITMAVIGLVVIIISWALSSFVIKGLVTLSLGTPK